VRNMGTIPGQDPGPTIKCMLCGRENPADRPYCYHCKQKLHDPIMDKMRTALNAAQAENDQLRQQLEPIQTENQQLREQLGPIQEELASLKAAPVSPPDSSEHVAALTGSLQVAKEKVAELESHAAGWENQWKAAEAKAAELEQKLVDKAKEVEAYFKKNPGTKPIPFLKTLVGAITLLGSLAGYSTGRYVQPRNDQGDRVKQLVAQVADAQQQIGNLKSSLNSANAKADQVQSQSQTDLSDATQKNTDLSAHQQQLQHQLNDSNQKATVADQNEKQLRLELDTANHKISALAVSEQQLQHQLTEANAQKASANETVGQLNAEIAKLHAQSAPKGSLIWSGNLTGRRTIEIKNEVPDYGELSGALPQKLCKVSTQDGRVKIKNRPSKSHLNDLSFEVSGVGLVQVRIDWEISQ
jgi:DNA repair exonuclease SbcCD ATPase subunit